MWWRSVIYTGLLFGSFLWLVPNVLWLISWLACRLFSCRVPYAPFGWTALALVVVLWGCLSYGHFVGRFHAEVNQMEFRSADLPAAFNGYRIVHISDLHVDSFDDDPDELSRLVDKVLEQEGDLILFTGDVTTGAFSAIPKHEAALQRLASKCPVISILGNHDFFIYSRRNAGLHCHQQEANRLAQYERETLKWTVLRNSHLLIPSKHDSSVIRVAGVDNINGHQGFPTIQMGDLAAALRPQDGETADVPFTVLMTHDPSHWRAEVLPQSTVQLTLSGHTHASQVRLFGWSMANLMFDECDGRYDLDGRSLYVNAGLGCTAPFRIGCPPEITVITLRQ